MNLTEAEIDAIAARIAGPIAQLEKKLDEQRKLLDDVFNMLKYATGIRADKHVLLTQEAMQLVNCKSRTTFCRWVRQYAPTSRVGSGRFSRPRLEIGRQRELNGRPV